ncbi:hypothetical protein ABEW05_009351 [Botrytis cinerea]
MSLSKITSAYFHWYQRCIYLTTKFSLAVKVELVKRIIAAGVTEALAKNDDIFIRYDFMMHWLPHTSLQNRASDRTSISKSSTKRECLNSSSNKIRLTRRKRTGQTEIHCRWEQEVGGNITSLEKPSPTKLSVVPSLRRHIDCDLEDSFEDILQQKGGPWELRKGVTSMYCPKVSLYGQEFKDINV